MMLPVGHTLGHAAGHTVDPKGHTLDHITRAVGDAVGHVSHAGHGMGHICGLTPTPSLDHHLCQDPSFGNALKALLPSGAPMMEAS